MTQDYLLELRNNNKIIADYLLLHIPLSITDTDWDYNDSYVVEFGLNQKFYQLVINEDLEYTDGVFQLFIDTTGEKDWKRIYRTNKLEDMRIEIEWWMSRE